MFELVSSPPTEPARHPEVLACAAQIEDLVASLCALARGAAGWDPLVRQSLLASLGRSADGLGLAEALSLAAEAAAGSWRGSGDASPEAWHGRMTGRGTTLARGQLRRAEQLAAVPAVAGAVAAGVIGLEHAVAIARVATTGSQQRKDILQSAAGQAAMVDLARHQDAGALSRTVERRAAELDPVSLERDLETQRAARYLHVTDTPQGTFVKGRLDRMAGHRLLRALDSALPRPAEGDERSSEQRRADALDAITGRVLASKDTSVGARVPAQVSFIVTEGTWKGARAETARRRAALTAAPRDTSPALSGAGCVDSGRAVAHPPATLEDGTPVPLTELAQAMCDCAVTRIVIDAQGAPMDLGRTERLFSGPQRRAVIARDRHCGWDGCDRRAAWCEVHHIDWWERDDGATSVENAVLLCSFHHHEVHRRDLVITRTLRAPQAAMGPGRDLESGPASGPESGPGREVLPDTRPGLDPPPLSPGPFGPGALATVSYTFTERGTGLPAVAGPQATRAA